MDGKRKISRRDLRNVEHGTPQYVYLHGLRQKRKGRNCSALLKAPFDISKNPRVNFKNANDVVNWKPVHKNPIMADLMRDRRLNMLLYQSPVDPRDLRNDPTFGKVPHTGNQFYRH